MVSVWIYFKVEPIRIVDGQNVGWKRNRGAKDGFRILGPSKPEGGDQGGTEGGCGADLPG